MKKLIWQIQAAAFYLFTLLFSLLPEQMVAPAGSLIGVFISRALPKRRAIAIDNIRQALPAMRGNAAWNCPLETPEEIASQMFRHLGTSLVETCRLYHGRGTSVFDRIEIRGRENYDQARAKEKGIIFLTGHCGNWELVALAYSRLFNSSMSVVARRQNNPYLNSMVEKMRMRYDNRVIYKDNAMRSMISVIRKNGAIGLLVDQAVFPEEGALIQFLGRTAWASKGPAILARKTGVAILPSFIHREGNRHIITINPECTFEGDATDEGMARDAKSYSGYIENFICAHPADWYWVHRRWKRAGEPVS